ncbi:hypothetical protein D9757_014643 [Collybiopsis confluens]|uniref:Magnesium transporter n=1 Tax=Collybiopsis confluens TaxID=2823264 RepID=A0A8H5FP74_9AGAR|nr:hypothetical protein D9757_014643 [Collybiopsis confluens]
MDAPGKIILLPCTRRSQTKAGALSFQFIGIYIITKKRGSHGPTGINGASNPIKDFHASPSGSASGLGYPGSLIICYLFDSSSCAALQSWVKYTLEHEPPWTTLLKPAAAAATATGAGSNNPSPPSPMEDSTHESENDILSLVLPILWFVVYSWADALETVYRKIENLENQILSIKSTSRSLSLSGQLHNHRRCLHNYQSHLQNLRKTVASLNPTVYQVTSGLSALSRTVISQSQGFSLDNYGIDPGVTIITEAKDFTIKNYTDGNANEMEGHHKDTISRDVIFQLTGMVAEIEQLINAMTIWNDRMRDVMGMVFSHVAISDGTAMKQIANITMVFIPSTFAAGIFGMNVQGISSESTPVWSFIVLAVGLTVLTLWGLIGIREGPWWPVSRFRRSGV